MIRTLAITALSLPIRAYRYFVSPLTGAACRFEPTCSQYCLQALEKHGPLAGIWLGLRRISRCHPWSGRHGYDPVPDLKKTTFWKKRVNDRHEQ